jgi:transposase InsO family protein
MKKELIRKEFFKLKIKGHSYSQCRKILFTKCDYEVDIRTLKRWIKRLDLDNNWDLSDRSRKPKKMRYKINDDIKEKIIRIRNKTGWGPIKINYSVREVSISTIKRFLKEKRLVAKVERKKKRNKYVRWQRKRPNSLWQIDHSVKKVDGKWLISIEDDCGRYSLGLFAVNRVTTEVVTQILEILIRKYGKPREILSDNGSAYGSKSKNSKFDRWCKRQGIKHIRSAVHSPTTCGKIERLFQTYKRERHYCNHDLELFRYRYNHQRAHESLDNKTPSKIYNDFNQYFHWNSR